MKIASVVSRYLLGIVFLVFGLNGFLHFIPMPPPTGAAGNYLMALSATPYISVIFLLQLLGGVLLLLGQYVPLALTLLAPIIVNILLFHIFLEPGGLPLALIVAILWVILAFQHRTSFAPLFVK